MAANRAHQHRNMGPAGGVVVVVECLLNCLHLPLFSFGLLLPSAAWTGNLSLFITADG